MRALVKYERGMKKVGLQEVPVPEPGPGQVRIHVKAAGICGTDVHIYYDDSYPTNPPVTLGHELSGVVDKVGEGVVEGLIGMRVTSETLYYTCGRCSYCRTGRDNLCMNKVSIGTGTNGAFTDYLIVPARNIHELPETISFEEAALTEPLSCCVQAVLEKTTIKPADTVLITGPGSIGLLCLQLAKISRARCIVVGAPHDVERLGVARNLGADVTLVSTDENIQKSVVDYCDGTGPDILLECSGSEQAINLGIEMLRKGGAYTQVGLAARNISIDINKLTLKEIAFQGTYATKWYAWHKSIQLIETGAVTLKPLVTAKLQLDDWQEGLQNAAEGVGIKSIFSFT